MRSFLLLWLFTVGITLNVFSQSTERIYQLDNGTVITRAQLDSLSNVHPNQLTFEYSREDGQIVVTITLPSDSLSTSNADIPTGFSASGGGDSFAPSEGDSLIKEVIFMNAEEEVISKEEFAKLMEVPGIKAHYSITVEEGVRRTIMRPSTNETAREYFQQMEDQRKTLDSMLGTPFPFETMTDIQGTAYTPENLTGKVVVLNYWFVECAPCIREMPFLNELAGEFEGRDDILFLAPSLSDSEKIVRMLETRPFSYSLIPDATQHANDIGIYAYPTNMVIDRSGNVAFMEIGYHEDTVEKLKRHINEKLK